MPHPYPDKARGRSGPFCIPLMAACSDGLPHHPLRRPGLGDASTRSDHRPSWMKSTACTRTMWSNSHRYLINGHIWRHREELLRLACGSSFAARDRVARQIANRVIPIHQDHRTTIMPLAGRRADRDLARRHVHHAHRPCHITRLTRPPGRRVHQSNDAIVSLIVRFWQRDRPGLELIRETSLSTPSGLTSSNGPLVLLRTRYPEIAVAPPPLAVPSSPGPPYRRLPLPSRLVTVTFRGLAAPGWAQPSPGA